MLKEIDITESVKWDEVVRSFVNYDVFYLNSYSKAFQQQGDGTPVLIYYENGKERAINVIMKRDVALDKHFQGILDSNQYFDISTPYGYGGFLCETSMTKQMVREYENYCLDKNYISEFVRFSLGSDYIKFYTGICQTQSHNVIRSLELPMDEILIDFEHKVRKNLKRADKNHLEIKIDESAQTLEGFLEIYYNTMSRNEAKAEFFFPKNFFETLNQMIQNTVYFHVLFEGKIIASELVLYGKNNCYSFLGGTDKDYFHLRPNEFLKFHIIKWAKEKNLKSFVLGGGYGSDDGIFQYKKSLAPHGIVDFYTGKKVFNHKVYQELVNLRKNQNNGFQETSPYFPLYRA